MLRIFQETIIFATKQIFRASNLDSIPTSHYLMELGPNPKKIPQNSGKQIRIPEGM